MPNNVVTNYSETYTFACVFVITLKMCDHLQCFMVAYLTSSYKLTFNLFTKLCKYDFTIHQNSMNTNLIFGEKLYACFQSKFPSF